MNNITWNIKSGDTENDIFGQLNNQIIDIVKSCDGTWTVLFSRKRLNYGMLNREEAKIWAEKTDLIKESLLYEFKE